MGCGSSRSTTVIEVIHTNRRHGNIVVPVGHGHEADTIPLEIVTPRRPTVTPASPRKIVNNVTPASPRKIISTVTPASPRKNISNVPKLAGPVRDDPGDSSSPVSSRGSLGSSLTSWSSELNVPNVPTDHQRTDISAHQKDITRDDKNILNEMEHASRWFSTTVHNDSHQLEQVVPVETVQHDPVTEEQNAINRKLTSQSVSSRLSIDTFKSMASRLWSVSSKDKYQVRFSDSVQSNGLESNILDSQPLSTADKLKLWREKSVSHFWFNVTQTKGSETSPMSKGDSQYHSQEDGDRLSVHSVSDGELDDLLSDMEWSDDTGDAFTIDEDPSGSLNSLSSEDTLPEGYKRFRHSVQHTKPRAARPKAAVRRKSPIIYDSDP